MPPASFLPDIVIGQRTVSHADTPCIVAEISANHNQSLYRALLLVDKAAEAGVDVIKLQTYTADTMTLDVTEPSDLAEAFIVKSDGSPGNGRSLYDLYAQAHTPWDWHKPIFDRARQHGMEAFSSPFDASAIALLESLDVPAYKIASSELVDLPLIEKVCATGKPVILSTGMASLSEIEQAVACAADSGCHALVVMHCVALYPASPESLNLMTLTDIEKRFGCLVGFSDHSVGIGASVAAVALGAVMIEKHITMSRADGGVDDAFSTTADEFATLVEACRQAHAAVGTVSYDRSPTEESNRCYRRSLYVACDVEAGEEVTVANVRSVRPAGGELPHVWATVVGKTFKTPVRKGTPFRRDMIS